MNTLVAARAQMAVSLAFHMVFAAIGIGLPFLLVIVEWLSLKTGRPHYRALAKAWGKTTGLLFAVGAISGTALSFELGLLWPRYMQITGAAVGHVFGLEGYAFLLEAIFLGLYLYGADRLSPWAHWWCAVAVAFSGVVSGWLVLGVNAWMQLPVGFTLDAAGQVVVSDPIAIFKRYGWFVMAIHSTLSCYMAVAFAVAGIYAWRWHRGKRDDIGASAIRIAMIVGGITALMQPLSGDALAKFVFQTQPAKFAALEAHFPTESHAPVLIAGIPDLQAHTTRYAIKIPWLLSILATHNPNTVVKGLDDIPRDLWPNVVVVHLAFDIMVGLGSLLPLAAIWYAIAVKRGWKRRGQPLDNRWLRWALIACGPCGFVALEAGWFVTEVGRQPWVIQGVLKTADAVTESRSVPFTFFLFTLLYLLLTATVLAYLLRTSHADHAEDAAAPQEAFT
jgi:cytochrome bd ubiquinol oxidase subunit I